MDQRVTRYADLRRPGRILHVVGGAGRSSRARRSSGCRRPSGSRCPTRSASACSSSSTSRTSARTPGAAASTCRSTTWRRFGCAEDELLGTPLGGRRCGRLVAMEVARARALLAAGAPAGGDACRSAPGWPSPASRPAGWPRSTPSSGPSNDVLAAHCRPRKLGFARRALPALVAASLERRRRHEHRSRLRLVRDRHPAGGEELLLRHPAAAQAGAAGALGGLRAGPAHRRHRRRRRRAGREARRPAARPQGHRPDRSAHDDDPVLVAVADAARRYGLPMACFGEIIDGCEMDVIGTSYETIDDLVGYCRRVAGSVGRLSLAVFGIGRPRAGGAAGRRPRRRPPAHQHPARRRRGPVTSAASTCPSDDAESVGCAPDLSGPAGGRGPARRLRVRPRRAVVRRGPAAAAAARPPQPRLCRGHGGHLPAPAGPDRARARSPSRGAASRCPPGRRRRWRRAAWRARSREPAADRRRRGRPGRDRRRAGGRGRRAPRSCCSSAGRRSAGLTSSIRRNGLSFDNGQHVFLRCCTAYRGFIDRIGASDQVFLQPRLDVPVLAPGRRTGLDQADRPARPAASPRVARRATATCRSRERVRLGRPALALRRLDPDDASLDDVSFGDWLRQHGQSERAIDRLWNLIALPTLNVPAARGVARARRRRSSGSGSSTGPTAATSAGRRCPLAELHGANAARALDAAGVETRARRRRSARSTARRRARSRSCATASARRPSTLSSSPRRRGSAATLGALRAPMWPSGSGRLRSSTSTWCSTARDRPRRWRPASTRRSSSSSTAPPRAGSTAGQCLAISLSAADGYIGQRLRPSSSSIFTRGAAANCSPGCPRGPASSTPSSPASGRRRSGRCPACGRCGRRPATEVPGLFLAGAWCDTGWPATMEGAVRSGRRRPRRRWPRSAGRRRSPRAPATAARGQRRDGRHPHPARRRRRRAGATRWRGRRRWWRRRSRPPCSASARELRPAVSQHLAGGGKYVRAGLVARSRRRPPGPTRSVGVVGAVAIELVHNFSLVHDDIIDGDLERRHRPDGVGRVRRGPRHHRRRRPLDARPPGPPRRADARAGAGGAAGSPRPRRR